MKNPNYDRSGINAPLHYRGSRVMEKSWRREFDYRQEIVNTSEIDYVRAGYVDVAPL